jgi:hypothetical protein
VGDEFPETEKKVVFPGGDNAAGLRSGHDRHKDSGTNHVQLGSVVDQSSDSTVLHFQNFEGNEANVSLARCPSAGSGGRDGKGITSGCGCRLRVFGFIRDRAWQRDISQLRGRHHCASRIRP